MSEHPKHDWSHALVNGQKMERCTGCRNFKDDPQFDATGPCAKIVEVGPYRLVIQLVSPSRAGIDESTDKVLSVHVSHVHGKLPQVISDSVHDDMMGRPEQWLQLFPID